MGRLLRSDALVRGMYHLRVAGEFTLLMNTASRAFHDVEYISIYKHREDGIDWYVFETEKEELAYLEKKYLNQQANEELKDLDKYHADIDYIDSVMNEEDKELTQEIIKFHQLDDRSNKWFFKDRWGNTPDNFMEHIGAFKARVVDTRPFESNELEPGKQVQREFKAHRDHSHGKIGFKLAMLTIVGIVEELYLVLDNRLDLTAVKSRIKQTSSGKFMYYSFDENETCLTIETKRDSANEPPAWVVKVQTNDEVMLRKLGRRWFKPNGNQKDTELFEETLLNL